MELQDSINSAVSDMNGPADSGAVKQVQPVQKTVQETEDLSIFFGIGIAINIIILVVFVIWAVKQWKMRNALRK